MKIIYSIPGIGTTGELFKNIAVPGYEIKVLHWPRPQRQFTLSDYAAAFIEQINDAEPVTLMGVSFGGMLCAELADKLSTNKVFLISSCKSRAEFPRTLRVLKFLPIHHLIPDRLIRFTARRNRRLLGFERSFDPLFFRMTGSMPRGYFSCCVNYIIHWNKTTSNPKIISIHGTADKLLPYRNIRQAIAIEKGSHTMILNNATQINAILNTELNGL